MEAEGEDWGPVKLAYDPTPSHPPIPLIHYWPFQGPFQGGSFIVVLFIYCYVMFHFLMFFFFFFLNM